MPKPRLVPIRLPAGVFRNGTDYETKGRWFDADLIRWYESSLQPIGGWQHVTDSVDAVVVVDAGNPVRGMLGWRSNAGINQLAMGTACKAFAFVLGVLTEITPSGITCGNVDATEPSGRGAYGDGLYGDGPYGGLISDTRNEIIEANTWQFDNFGEILVANSFADGRLYTWDLNIVNDLVVIPNAPLGNVGVVVTPERFLVALGKGGDRRLVAWSDQEDHLTWAETATNQAGDFPLSGAGQLMAGRRGRNETLLWTDKDLWAMRFIGGQLVFSFTQVGVNVGAISRHSMVMFGSQAFWMSHRGFHSYDGFTESVPSDVADFVFNDINRFQASKIYAVGTAEFREVTWFYPSAGSTENDRYVTYNYQDDIWTIGTLERTAGIDRGPHAFPLMTDPSGNLWEHEKGVEYSKPDLVAVHTPFAETGPIEIGDGDVVYTILSIVPDDKTLGEVSADFRFRNFPDSGEVQFVFTLNADQTFLRKTARSVRMRFVQVSPAWRVGVVRLEVVESGRR